MGLCPSRNRSIASGKVMKESVISTPPGLDPPTPPTNFKLRADADEFVPQPQTQPSTIEKEPWEKFLDQKQKEVVSGNKNNFPRKVDGTFTADYRRLLEAEKPAPRRYVPPQQRGNMGKTDDLIREWKETEFKPKKSYGTAYPEKRPEKKTKQSGPKEAQTRFEECDMKLRAALTKVKSNLAAKEAVKDLETLEEMKASRVTKDDAELAKGQVVPFGLTDYHYFSDTADAGKSSQHVGKITRKPKDYAKNQKITPELEEAMTEVLFRLRGLRNVESNTEGLEKNRRYCVGIREVSRALKDAEKCPLKAVLVAPDVEQGGRTVRGSLDEKLGQLISTCKDLKIPVVYGLSRVRLGQAIKKSVTISVMGILDVRGMQEPFDQMLTLAA